MRLDVREELCKTNTVDGHGEDGPGHIWRLLAWKQGVTFPRCSGAAAIRLGNEYQRPCSRYFQFKLCFPGRRRAVVLGRSGIPQIFVCDF